MIWPKRASSTFLWQSWKARPDRAACAKANSALLAYLALSKREPEATERALG